MCRIAGIINSQLAAETLAINVKAMCNIMAHGGPDDEGIYQDAAQGLTLGHRRLSLIDLSPAGHQPMYYQNEQLVISFNGEIYNFQELKSELINNGLEFNTHSDTEVILAGYTYWGTALFNKLRGMFAFALYDKIKGLTYLVRDSMGIKPLYYSIAKQQLIFASEMKAFQTATPNFAENPNWKVYFLSFGHIPEPYTTLAGVMMLPKAHYLTWNHQTQKAKITSFEIQTQKRIHNTAAAEIAVKQTLTLAVQRHLIADAPIGVFLSGGIDSSLLTLLADQLINDNNATTTPRLNTVSINFENPQFSEKIYQDEVLKQVKAKHALYTVDQTVFDNYFPTALAAMDQPTADGINSWFVNYYAKENGLKAVLSGIGADEIFGGYPSFKRMGFVNKLSSLPKFIIKLALKLKNEKIKRAYYLSYQNTVGKYLFLRGFFTPDDIAALLGISIAQVDETLKTMDIPTIPKQLEAEEQAGWLETHLFMQNQLLKDTDSMSMQHGIEVRVPFLDQDLIGLLESIPNDIKFKTDKPKGLLINSFINLIPQKIWDRPKMGFTFPFQYWLKDNVHFLASMDLKQNQKANSLIADFKVGNLHWSKALAIYQVFKKE